MLICGFVMMSGCGEVTSGDDGDDEETVSPVDQEEEVGSPVDQGLLPNCYVYRCPRNGRTYVGTTDYEARHRCELNCGNFCTFVENVCV
jgi:hypothetical protein